MQLSVPLQGAPHPVKVDFQSARAPRVIGTPLMKLLVQPDKEPLAQAMPAGSLFTEPPPLPSKETVSIEQGAVVKEASVSLVEPALLEADTRKW